MLRLCQVNKQLTDKSIPSQLETTLFGSFEVGYRKDVVRWTDETSLKEEIDKRIGLINFEPTYITTPKQALEYFRKAALRNEAVFVSYAGEDAVQAGPIIESLKRRFQKVFDYRAKERSIPAGAEWLKQIFKEIAATPIGVILLSPDYVASGYCEHEMNEMIAQKDGRGMKIVPIRLREVAVPYALGATQYLRLEDFKGADQLAEALVQDVDRATSG